MDEYTAYQDIQPTTTQQTAPLTVRANAEPITRLKSKVVNSRWIDWILWGTSIGLVGTIGWATLQDTTPISVKKPKQEFNSDLALSVSANEMDKFLSNFDVFIEQEQKNLVQFQARKMQDALAKEIQNPKNPACFRRTLQECAATSINKRAAELSQNTAPTVTVKMTQADYQAYILNQVNALAIATQNKNIGVVESRVNLAIAQIQSLASLYNIHGKASAEGQARMNDK